MFGQSKKCLIKSGAEMRHVGTMSRAILFLLCVTLCASSQSPKPNVGQKPPTAKKNVAVPTTGELDGFVFLITEGGDIKPARLASVVLLYVAERQSALSGKPLSQLLTPGAEYMINYANELSKETSRLMQEEETKNFGSKEAHCSGSLASYVGALKSTIDWAVENKKTSQIITVDADEEGRFKTIDVPVGLYTVTVYGRAGINQAFWEDDVQVTAGDVISIKMRAPKESCVKHDE